MSKPLIVSIRKLFCGPNCAHASFIKYDITNTIDSEGNNFSGFVNINSNPNFDGIMHYDIGQYEFKSSAGIARGDSGKIYLQVSPSDNTISGSSGGLFNNTFVENYVGKLNSYTWGGSGTGVTFVGAVNTRDGYSVLSQEIRIDMTSTACLPTSTYWGLGVDSGKNIYGVTLIKSAPVPKPCTLLLLGSRLLGLAGSRKKLQ